MLADSVFMLDFGVGSPQDQVLYVQMSSAGWSSSAKVTPAMIIAGCFFHWVTHSRRSLRYAKSAACDDSAGANIAGTDLLADYHRISDASTASSPGAS